jgi:hypothetical protein
VKELLAFRILNMTVTEKKLMTETIKLILAMKTLKPVFIPGLN